mmetsp:Transcript_64737/g.146042  ORF Transcript_64737/g.146042 Transcript_64737/m.146042 type:complete len:120 (-) Transcript_64737:215-574(-)
MASLFMTDVSTEEFWKTGGMPERQLRQLEKDWAADKQLEVERAKAVAEEKTTKRLCDQELKDLQTHEKSLVSALETQKKMYERRIKNTEEDIEEQKKVAQSLTVATTRSHVSRGAINSM